MKREDVCWALLAPKKCLVRLTKRLPILKGDCYSRWEVEGLKSGVNWSGPVEEIDLSDPVNEMEVLAWAAKA